FARSEGPQGTAHICVLGCLRAEHATLPASLICLALRALRSKPPASGKVCPRKNQRRFAGGRFRTTIQLWAERTAGGEKTLRGKSGHHRARAVGNAHPGKPAGKCHRNTRPMARPHVSRVQAKVKWCGKSAPASRRRGGQANPARCKAKQD